MVKIGPAVIGDGHVKICVPLVGVNLEALETECRFLADKVFDVVELRIDFLGQSYNKVACLEALAKVRQWIPDAGLLLTWRTQGEGGEKGISSHDYFDFLTAVILSGHADAIDLEYFFDQEGMQPIVKLAKEKGITIIMSNHDFAATPEREEIESRLIGMRKAGADVAKLACMPQSTDDVLTLLAATNNVKKAYPDQVLITMSMGQLGVITRICGSLFGNAMSFGAAKQASAPGQVDAGLLHSILAVVDK